MPRLQAFTQAAIPLALLATVATGQMAGVASAQEQEAPREVELERCPRFVASAPWLSLPGFVGRAEAAEGEVRLTFIGHATFLIESPAGVTIATDYNDGVRPPVVPRIATMNRAHITHFTFNPDPGVEHVLHGWGEDGVPARHELTVEDVWCATSPPISAAASACRARSSAT